MQIRIPSLQCLFQMLNWGSADYTYKCSRCGGNIYLNQYHGYTTYRCRQCYDNGGLLEFCIHQLKHNTIEEAYKFIGGEYNPLSYSEAFEQAKIIIPSIFYVWGEQKILTEPPEGFQTPYPCSVCGHRFYIYKPRENGNCGNNCLICGKGNAHTPHDKKPLSNRGNQNQQANYRTFIKERYGGQCALCGSQDKLEVHHILPVSIDNTYNLEPNNGILLCKKHHDIITDLMREGIARHRKEDGHAPQNSD